MANTWTFNNTMVQFNLNDRDPVVHTVEFNNAVPPSYNNNSSYSITRVVNAIFINMENAIMFYPQGTFTWGPGNVVALYGPFYPGIPNPPYIKAVQVHVAADGKVEPVEGAPVALMEGYITPPETLAKLKNETEPAHK